MVSTMALAMAVLLSWLMKNWRAEGGHISIVRGHHDAQPSCALLRGGRHRIRPSPEMVIAAGCCRMAFSIVVTSTNAGRGRPDIASIL